MRPLILPGEVAFIAIRAQGPGGQNVNKVSSAVQLRFDVAASSLPDEVKQRLLATADQRLNKHGVLVIKAKTARTQEQNKAEALARLHALVAAAAAPVIPRKPTRPTQGSIRRRLQGKAERSAVKALRARLAGSME